MRFRQALVAGFVCCGWLALPSLSSTLFLFFLPWAKAFFWRNVSTICQPSSSPTGFLARSCMGVLVPGSLTCTRASASWYSMLSRSESEAFASCVDVAFPWSTADAAVAAGAGAVVTVCCKHAISVPALQLPLPLPEGRLSGTAARWESSRNRSGVKINPRSKAMVSTGAAGPRAPAKHSKTVELDAVASALVGVPKGSSTGGSESQIKAALQEAVVAVEEHLRPTGLKCSPTKSELLVISPQDRKPTLPFPAHAGDLDAGPNRNDEADSEAHPLTSRGFRQRLPRSRNDPIPKTKSIPSQPTATFCSGTKGADASTHRLTETYNAAKEPHCGSCKYKPYGPPSGQNTFARMYTPRIYANSARRREPPRDTSSGTVRRRRVTKKQCQPPSAARSSAESQATKETWSSILARQRPKPAPPGV
ncbi:hypothetical protein HPB50_001566 [Hyalomma asiaticum]|uniref:Uncharacterized protein n=1 Tax=Hyalomma asiaticum TaxID=266040 RepID=A0ACB7RRE6_HYAAI|nr:hypothetical protein HPB50_001566 [Hyalomma asiaticum]